MSIRTTTPVATEVLSVAEAKDHLEIHASYTEKDSYVARLIKAAREACEHELNGAVGAQSITMMLDEFPWSVYGVSASIMLERPPLIAVTSVKYIDGDGVEQTLAQADYAIDMRDGQPSWLMPAYGAEWPETREQANAVEIIYEAGWSESNCPENIKQYMLMLIGAMYENREQTVANVSVAVLGFAARLLDRYRVHEL